MQLTSLYKNGSPPRSIPLLLFNVNMIATRVNQIKAVRGPRETLPDEVFIFRHQPISRTYFGCRLRTYGKRCGVRVTPHQLRHTCATLLLNAGAPVLAVQAILGHQHIDTTMRYARLYDGTLARDYFKAMEKIEAYLPMPFERSQVPVDFDPP